eukprot:7375980-Prymnesium_polylepis.1
MYVQVRDILSARYRTAATAIACEQLATSHARAIHTLESRATRRALTHLLTLYAHPPTRAHPRAHRPTCAPD